MTRSDDRQILKARARQLALPSLTKRASPGGITVLEFALAHERYGVEQKFVGRVSRVRSVTALPGVPGYVVGITFAGGRIISVVDLKALFGLPKRGLSEKDRMIIVGNSLLEFAILADEVLGQRHVDKERIIPRAANPGDGPDPYLHGVTADGLIVVDLARILISKNIVIH